MRRLARRARRLPAIESDLRAAEAENAEDAALLDGRRRPLWSAEAEPEAARRAGDRGPRPRARRRHEARLLSRASFRRRAHVAEAAALGDERERHEGAPEPAAPSNPLAEPEPLEEQPVEIELAARARARAGRRAAAGGRRRRRARAPTAEAETDATAETTRSRPPRPSPRPGRDPRRAQSPSRAPRPPAARPHGRGAICGRAKAAEEVAAEQVTAVLTARARPPGRGAPPALLALLSRLPRERASAARRERPRPLAG